MRSGMLRGRWMLRVALLIGVSGLCTTPAARADIWVVPDHAGVAGRLALDFLRSKWVVLARVSSLESLCEGPPAYRSNCGLWSGELQVLEHFIPSVPQPQVMRYLHLRPHMPGGPPGDYAVGDTVVVFLRPSDSRQLGVVPKEWGWTPRLDGRRVSIFGRSDDLDRDSLLTLCRKLGARGTPEYAKSLATLAVRAEVIDREAGTVRLRVREARGNAPLPSRQEIITVTRPIWSDLEPVLDPKVEAHDEVIAFLRHGEDSASYLAPAGMLSFWRIEWWRCVIQPRHHSPVQFEPPREACYVEPGDLLRSVPRSRVLALMRNGWDAPRSDSPAAH